MGSWWVSYSSARSAPPASPAWRSSTPSGCWRSHWRQTWWWPLGNSSEKISLEWMMYFSGDNLNSYFCFHGFTAYWLHYVWTLGESGRECSLENLIIIFVIFLSRCLHLILIFYDSIAYMSSTNTGDVTISVSKNFGILRPTLRRKTGTK